MSNIYKKFNDIEVDLDEINSVNLELDDIAKKRIKNNIKNSIKVKKHRVIFKTRLIVSGILLILLSSSIIPKLSFTALAENIPILNSVFKSFDSSYGGNFEDYTQVVGKVKKDKGYEVKIDEVVMDDFSFRLIYTIKSDKKFSEITKGWTTSYPYTPGKSIKFNGKDFGGASRANYKIINDYTVQVIEDYDIYTKNISQNLDVEIDFKKVNRINGNWKFGFFYSKEKISKSIKTYFLNKQLIIKNDNGKNVTFTFEKLSFSPISTVILFSANNSDFDSSKLKFKNENENVIEVIGGSGYGDDFWGYSGLEKFKPMKKIPSKIIVEYDDKNSPNFRRIELPLK
ncbi:DUF4179 domain-containing protein [Clostridium cylindrosporum]|uniref:DUF4179 domain-containing protein n=1 Tax=Clostridium cylindrosporum DSM 605 TaxID=1121307 RepID=A0A0J8DCB3_CLOCY|nr:DUF4179 domain-containing protein [Clostridium cylindrosporum]KMT21944.1 hypothetical protein CLCY_3c02150 [Clostridium cylindrosporum DSM 605]